MTAPKLPDAEVRHPACGCCGGDTDFDGDVFWCEPCGLDFDRATMEAAFRDAEAETCGNPCENGWHEPDRLRPGSRFTCTPCQLPAGHTSLHWTACERAS